MALISVISAQDTSAVIPNFYHLKKTNPFQLQGFKLKPQSMGMPADSLSPIPRGWLNVPYGDRVIEIYIDRDWKYITLTESIDGYVLRMPFIAPMDWYFSTMIQVNRRDLFVEKVNKLHNKESTDAQNAQRGQALEVVGVNLGGLGRASLRVRGNVNISGKMVFQDQELVASSIRQSQNTHFEFDQKQNLNIEGKIGDRITVKMDQDSERDFDWENNIRITYDGKEDDIIQKVEAGNISLSLPSTQYVTFSGSNKGLFGLKAISKLGPVDITTIASIEQTKKEQQKYTGGNEEKTQNIKDYEYVKNQHFMVHEWFRNGVSSSNIQGYTGSPFEIQPFFPLDANGYHQYPTQVKITDFELYKLDASNDPSALIGTAYVNPLAADTVQSELNETGTYVRLERNIDYFISEDYGYLRLRTRSQDGEVLGCTFSLSYYNAVGQARLLKVGHGITETDSTLALKMIKPKSSNPGHPTWNLMLKNVYYLGATNINKDGFAVRIVYELGGKITDRAANGQPYITQFGLDIKSKSGNLGSDELIDLDNTNMLSLGNGELLFPMYHPFAALTDSMPDGNPNPMLGPILGSGDMYFKTDRNSIENDNRFRLEVDYSNPSSTINLGFMLVEGSEEISINNEKLTRGIDYQIDYFTGTIILQNDKAKDPNANILILYDKYEIVSFDKKVIMGTRAQMDLSKNSFIGATALYFNQSVIDKKVDIGYEPTRNFIWDLNGRYELGLDGLSRWIDRLPLLETDQSSNFSIEGELAQVLPNPNPISNRATGDPDGVAFIDDFEGSKRTTNPSILRRYWKLSSAPVDLISGKPWSQFYRGNMWWYNPYDQVRTKSIWPNQSTSVQAGNETTDILVLQMKRKAYQDGAPIDSLWSGITTSFYSGDYDQTKSKFFEIWVKGTKGNLSIDLGKVSEDQDGNGRLNTEDKAASLPIGNGLLDEGEDTGLDGCFDEYEDGWGGCLTDSTYAWYLEQYNLTGLPGPINPEVDDPNDPNGDNWHYIAGSTDYTKINGTEGNGSGPNKQEGGLYPDTEDLDRSGFIDKVNDYFTVTFALSDTTYLAGITTDNNVPTGWRLFRIPLNHFTANNNITWSDIRHLRLVWSNVPLVNDTDVEMLRIAKIEMVGNEWRELGVAGLNRNDYKASVNVRHSTVLSEIKRQSYSTSTSSDSIFAITVINTEDNAEYVPPRGVKGEYDPINQLNSKEQSLVMQFNGLPAQTQGAAKKTLLSLTGQRAQSYLTYNKLKMYVYGDSPWIHSDRTDVELFVQFGHSEGNYYEIIQPVYTGWDEENKRNSILVDLNWMTALKSQDTSNVHKYRGTDIFTDSTTSKHYQFTDEFGNLTGKQINVKGTPALNRLKYFIVGVRNVSNEPISGRIWLDELRMSEVKKDKGTAMRVQTRLNVADIGNTTIMYSRKDADFHVLQERLGSNNTNEDFRINSSLKLHKFFPKSWGLNMPLSATYANSINRPKYIPSTDILVNQADVPDSIKALSESVSLTANISKSSKSDNRLVKYTLDNLDGSFNASRSTSSTDIMEEVINQSYSWKANYRLNFGRDNYFSPFKWLGGLPYIGTRFKEFNVYYTPASVSANANLNEKLVTKKARNSAPSPNDYNLGLNRTLDLDYKLLESLSTKYKITLTSDLKDMWGPFGYDWAQVKNVNPGILTSSSENLSTSFKPTIFSWLKPNFTHSAGYRWDQPRGNNYGGARIGTQLRFSSGVTLTLVSILETVYKPPKAQTPVRGTTRRPKPGRADEEDQGKDKKQQKEIKSLTFVHEMLKKVDPVNLSYTETLNRTGNGVTGTPPVGYKFGWLPEHGLGYSDQVATSNRENWDHKQDFSFRSGVRPTRNINVSVNYSQNMSQTINGSGIQQWAISRDYLAYGKFLEKGIPFTGWSIRLSGLEKLPYISKYVRTASLDHNFSGKESRAWQFEDGSFTPPTFWKFDQFIQDYTGDQRSFRVNSSFAPLAGITMALKRGISLNLRYNTSKSLEESNGGQTLRTESSYNAGANYTHRGGLTIPLPMMDDFHIDNTLNFTFNFDNNSSITQGKTKEKTKFDVTRKDSGWKAGMRISYSFTSRVSGGVIYEYRESKNKTTGRKIDRNFGFDVNIAISG